MSDIRYIIFKGGLQPKNPMEATDDKLKELSSVGYRQGTDYDIVSLKVLEDMLGGKKFAHGGMMNMDEMTRPLGYKFGTKDGTLVGDRERDVEEDLKEWEKDAIDKLRRERDIEKLLEKMPEILDEFKTPEEFFKKIPDMEKEGELPDWVKEFLEKRRKDPFERLLPKREDEGEPFIPKFGDRFFLPPKKDPRYDPNFGDRFFFSPKNDPRYDPNFGDRFFLPPKKDPRYDPRYDPNFGDRFFFSPKKDPRLEEFLGDETSGLMEDSSGIKILGMKLQLQKVLSLDMIDKMEDMSPIEIEILYNDTFGKVS